MRTTTVETHSRKPPRVLAPALALLLLSLLAAPADAQRGRGGSGHRGGAHASHHGGGHGAFRHGSRGGNHHARSHGRHGHRGVDHFRGHPRRHSAYRGKVHYGGYVGYRSAYRHPVYHYRPYAPYVYYGSPGYYGFGAYVYPGIRIDYHASPRYVVRGGGYGVVELDVEDATSIDVAGGGVTERGEPVDVEAPLDVRQPPARIKLTIEPGDASIYLDGAFLGLASELPEELWIDAGVHRLEIARPGYAGRDVDLELEAGEELEVDARLEAESRVPDLQR